MAAGLEPVDLSKKVKIEEILVAERDDAIINVAKLRKYQPSKCRRKARNVASSVIQYYSRVCVKADTSAKSHLASNLLKEISSQTPCDPDFGNMSMFGKVITECLAERDELMKAQKQHRENVKEKDRTGKRNRRRFPHVSSAHFHSMDFVVDEKCV